MIMDLKCPYCGSDHLNMGSPDEEWWGDDLLSRWHARCDNGHEFIVSEYNELVSRLVAKDDEDLSRLADEEDEKESE